MQLIHLTAEKAAFYSRFNNEEIQPGWHLIARGFGGNLGPFATKKEAELARDQAWAARRQWKRQQALKVGNKQLREKMLARLG